MHTEEPIQQRLRPVVEAYSLREEGAIHFAVEKFTPSNSRAVQPRIYRVYTCMMHFDRSQLQYLTMMT